LPANHLIPEQSFARLLDLVKAGAKLLVYKALPGDVPGLSRLDSRSNELKGLLNQLKFEGAGKVQTAVLGRGAVIISSDVETLMQAAKIRQEQPGGDEVYMLRRKTADGKIYFINNRSDSAISKWIRLADTAVAAALFDPASGAKGLAAIQPGKDGGILVQVQLAPHASLIVQTFTKGRNGLVFPYQYAAG